MKKIIIPIFLVAIAMTVSAQNVRLNFHNAYVFDASYDVYNSSASYYNGKVKGGYQVGGGIEWLPGEGSYGGELMYLHQSTNAPTHFRFGDLTSEGYEDFSVKLDYIMLCADRHLISANNRAEGFAGLMGGMVISNVRSSENGSASATNFAWGARLGSNIWVTEKLGIKLQAQLLAASRVTGGDLYFSYWGPVGIPTYSTLWQFEVGGGLTFKLGQ